MTERGAAAADRPIRVLFVCTGNSARSIMAESVLRDHGGARFDVHSAGTDPRGINPLTARVLGEAGLPTQDLASESVLDYVGQPFDYVITVCDNARQTCPVFPGDHHKLHWSIEDPAGATGSENERLRVFRATFDEISRRVAEFAASANRQARSRGNAILRG